MARTIDNLGLDISNQYAEGREAYDESLVKESKAITSQFTYVSKKISNHNSLYSYRCYQILS